MARKKKQVEVITSKVVTVEGKEYTVDINAPELKARANKAQIKKWLRKYGSK